jgi:hypothetical protein
MIERYTLKFTPAVSQEELRKKLEAIRDYDPAELDRLHKMKAKLRSSATLQTCESFAVSLRHARQIQVKSRIHRK